MLVSDVGSTASYMSKNRPLYQVISYLKKGIYKLLDGVRIGQVA